MIRRDLAAASAAILALGAAASAAPRPYTLDLGHAHVGWQTDHLGLSSTVGTFTDFDGTFLIDEADPAASSIRFTVRTASIDSNHEGRDNHLRAADFLDAATYPEMTFTSTAIEMTSETEGKVTGDLTMHGVTAPLTLDFRLTRDRTYPSFLPNYDELRVVGFEAEGVVDRTKHGMTSVSFPGSPVPDEIALDIHFDLVDCEGAPDTNVPCNWGRTPGFEGPSE